MLAGAGLRDQAALAHPAGQQSLAQGLVGLVGAPVEQVLPLEVEPRPGAGGEVAAAIERGRAPGVMAEQVGQLALKRRVLLGI